MLLKVRIDLNRPQYHISTIILIATSAIGGDLSSIERGACQMEKMNCLIIVTKHIYICTNFVFYNNRPLAQNKRNKQQASPKVQNPYFKDSIY